MHEQLDRRTKKGSSKRENIGLLIGIGVTLIAAVIMDGTGMPQKWHAAIFGTTVPFVFVILSYPPTWLRRWSFWASIGICLTLHLVGIWVFFQYALKNVQRLGWGLWLPVASIEAIVLLVAVKKIEEKLTGNHEIVDISGPD